MTYSKKTILKATILMALPGGWNAGAQTAPALIDIANAPLPIQILVRSPAETHTDLQVICLFRSSPMNALHGSLTEIDERLKGLLDRIRKPELFGGELGETLLIASPKGSLDAKELLLIGLGDSRNFSPQRMQLVGKILYDEAARIGVAHPFFAPAILDGGVTGFTTGQVAEEVIHGFLQASATDNVLRESNAAAGQRVTALTYLAGAKNASGTREGIEKAVAAAARK